MSDLRPCPECDRHVRNDETSCPFCSAELSEASPRKLPIGRLTRAAVFAGALVGASACGPAQTPTANPDDQQPPPPAEVADAGNPSPEEPPDAQAAAQPPPPADAQVPIKRPRPDHNIPMPYGAPPARQRLV